MKYTETQIKNPCYGPTSHTDFLGLAEFFYNDRFEARIDGYILEICPFLNWFGLNGFRQAFKPEDKDEGNRWFDSFRTLSEIDHKEIDRVNDHRVFALLFMHELHKDYLENYYSVE
jgi:hypothetical protein